MVLNKDFAEFVELLNKHKVDYMVVGGYALAFHGKPRQTGDIDIWIHNSEDNAQKMVNVVHEFGMGSLGLSKEDFKKEGAITQLGYPPLRIDVLNSIDGVQFKEAAENLQVIDLNGLKINFIGKDELIQNKLASGREQDLSDVKELNEGRKMRR